METTIEISPLIHAYGDKWCSSKLPCGRCITNAINNNYCIMKPTTAEELGCHDCKLRFKCWSIKWKSSKCGTFNIWVSCSKCTDKEFCEYN